MLCIDIREGADVGFVAKIQHVNMLDDPVVLGGLPFFDLGVFPIFEAFVHDNFSRKDAKHSLLFIS